MTKTMYLLPKEHSNALRMYGSTVMETTVTTGRKYFTDSTGRRYPVAEPELDVNGNTYYSEYDPQYSGDFLLFETKDAAQLHLECRELLSKIISMRSKLDKLPHAKLAAIVNLLESGSGDGSDTVIFATKEDDARTKILRIYKESDACIDGLLKNIVIEGLSVASQMAVFESLNMRYFSGKSWKGGN